MSTDYAFDILKGNFGDAADAKAAAEAVMAETLVIPVAAAGTAGTPLAEGEWVGIPCNAEILSAHFSAGTGVAADAANTATIVLSKFDAAGANKTTVASRQTITANAIVAKTGWALTLAAGAQYVVAGGSLAVEVTKQSSGVATPAGKLTIRYRPRNI